MPLIVKQHTPSLQETIQVEYPFYAIEYVYPELTTWIKVISRTKRMIITHYFVIAEENEKDWALNIHEVAANTKFYFLQHNEFLSTKEEFEEQLSKIRDLINAEFSNT